MAGLPSKVALARPWCWRFRRRFPSTPLRRSASRRRRRARWQRSGLSVDGGDAGRPGETSGQGALSAIRCRRRLFTCVSTCLLDGAAASRKLAVAATAREEENRTIQGYDAARKRNSLAGELSLGQFGKNSSSVMSLRRMSTRRSALSRRSAPPDRRRPASAHAPESRRRHRRGIGRDRRRRSAHPHLAAAGHDRHLAAGDTPGLDGVAARRARARITT